MQNEDNDIINTIKAAEEFRKKCRSGTKKISSPNNPEYEEWSQEYMKNHDSGNHSLPDSTILYGGGHMGDKINRGIIEACVNIKSGLLHEDIGEQKSGLTVNSTTTPDTIENGR